MPNAHNHTATAETIKLRNVRTCKRRTLRLEYAALICFMFSHITSSASPNLYSIINSQGNRCKRFGQTPRRFYRSLCPFGASLLRRASHSNRLNEYSNKAANINKMHANERPSQSDNITICVRRVQRHTHIFRSLIIVSRIPLVECSHVCCGVVMSCMAKYPKKPYNGRSSLGRAM